MPARLIYWTPCSAPRVPPRPSITLAVVTSPRPARDPQTEQQRRCVEVTQACFCTNGSICNANKYHQHASSPLHPHWMLVDVVSSWHKVPKNNTTLERQCGDSVVTAWYQRDTSVVTAGSHVHLLSTCSQQKLPSTMREHACTCPHLATQPLQIPPHILQKSKKLNHSTRDSHVVPHHGTSQAALWLTSQIGRDAVLSKSYGRG